MYAQNFIVFYHETHCHHLSLPNSTGLYGSRGLTPVHNIIPKLKGIFLVCMYVCTCMYVYMCVCVYVCAYVCMFVCMTVRMYVCMYVCMFV